MNYDEMKKHLQTLREARSARPKPIRAFEAVQGLVDRGRQHLRAWENVRGLVHGDDSSIAELASSFFLVTALAHLEVATLHAAKLTDSHPDSVSLGYLLNLLVEEGRSLFPAEWQNVHKVVLWGRSRLTEMQPVVATIKSKRDQNLAHLDRLYVNAAEDDADAVDVGELNRVFGLADEILQRLCLSGLSLNQVGRPLSEVLQEYLGTEGLDDLVHFARAGFANELVKSPSPRAEEVRRWDRALRESKLSWSSHAEDTV